MFLDKGDILGYRIIEEKIKTKTPNPGSFVSGEAQNEIGWLDKLRVIRAGGAVSKKLLVVFKRRRGSLGSLGRVRVSESLCAGHNLREKENDQEKKEIKCDDLIDALLEKHGKSPAAVLGENGLIAQLKKRVVERALAGELTLARVRHHHLHSVGERAASKRFCPLAITNGSKLPLRLRPRRSRVPDTPL